MNKIFNYFFFSLYKYYFFLKNADFKNEIKLHYGCGANRQNSYINVDIRWTPAVDMIASLKWCSRYLSGRCAEIYISHVLEHYGYPGKEMKDNTGSVIDALKDCHKALSENGVLRVAVPDFETIAKLYIIEGYPLYPRLSGRLCGEQNYVENLHRCVFDRAFLEKCLELSGFGHFEEWSPYENGISHDSSSDSLNGVKTSLNILAKKI